MNLLEREKKNEFIKICDHNHEKLRNQHHLLIKLFKKMFDCHVLVDHQVLSIELNMYN